METADLFPRHKCGLYLTHNEHRDTYTPVAQFIADRELEDDFASPEDMQAAIDTDECWVLQWYPSTPIGFHVIAAPTFMKLLAMLDSFGGDA